MATKSSDGLRQERPPFVIIGKAIIQDSRVTGSELLVYLALCSHADDAGSCFPSYATIAKEARLCRRTAIVAVRGLLEKGYLSKTVRKHSNGGPASNVYTIKNQYLHVPIQGGGSASGAPPLVHTMHYPSAPGAPELYSSNKKHIASSTPPSKKAPKTPEGYAEFVAELLSLHKAKSGSPYAFTGRDGSTVKRLLRVLGLETALGKLRSYYRDALWFTRDQAYSLGGFSAHINELAAMGNGHDPGYPRLDTEAIG